MLLSIKRIYSLFVCCLAGTLLLSGCITRDEGCLDVNADNFALEAEKNCTDCCTYPSMMLTLTQKWGDRNFSTTDTLYDLTSQPYKIIDLKYFLTSWFWTEQDGSKYTVDSLSTDCANETSFRYTPDILLIDTRQFSYTLGDVRKAVGIDGVGLLFGSRVDYSCLDPDDTATPDVVTDQSPLWNKEAGQLHTLRLVLQKNLAEGILDTIYVPWSTDIILSVDPIGIDMVSGTDTILKLTADYQEWFKDAHVADLNTFISSIVTNLSLRLTP